MEIVHASNSSKLAKLSYDQGCVTGVEVNAFQSEAATRMKNRRTARRYDLSLPITVRVPIGKEVATRNGMTRDISTHGVYFTIDNNLRTGAELDMTMTLPAEPIGASTRSSGSPGKSFA